MAIHPNKVHKKERGQALILIALAFVVIMAFVGLALDVGQLFIAMGELRRAADAGALAAAAQFREGRSVSEMEASAREAISMNGMDPLAVNIELCDPFNPDPQLCSISPAPPRKMVRVTASATVDMAFMSVIGITSLDISAQAVSEAASMDVVLVIDISESMTFEADTNPSAPRCQGENCDPSVCNNLDPSGTDGFPGECQPFEKVKEAAINFIRKILNKSAVEEEDRIGIVTFADGWSADIDLGTHYRPARVPYWTSDVNEAVNIIRNLRVYEPDICASNTWLSGTVQYGPCRNYSQDTPPVYQGLYCEYCQPGPTPKNGTGDLNGDGTISGGEVVAVEDWSPYMTTNIGGGLRKAGLMFGNNTREDALWIVILLTDGLANATDMQVGDDITDIVTYPIGFCPDFTNLCQDNDTNTRHDEASSLYDADDYARDMAEFVACQPDNPAADCVMEGQGAVIFTIGLGPEVTRTYTEVHGTPYGAALLRFIAGVGIDSDPSNATDPCSGSSDFTEWCGNYYFSPSGGELNRVFEDIASRIFTRLVH